MTDLDSIGDPVKGRHLNRRGKMIEERIASGCQPIPIAGCSIWAGYSTHDGYGRIRHKGRMKLVHRIAFELRFGPIPKGAMVCHRCDVRSCCNPAHLFLGSNKDNMLDMRAKGRQSRGASRPSAKLTLQQAAEIRERAASGETVRSLGAFYGVGKSTVSRVVRGEGWVPR